LTSVPYLRQGFDFTLPGVRIRVAEECSGIRSTLALLITTLLACHLFLRSSWKRLILCLVVVPIAMLKNGLRIFTLSTLAVYVNPGFLHGNLHKYGGIPFFAVALIPIAMLLIFLEKSDNPRPAMANGA
jgi:exosortase